MCLRLCWTGFSRRFKPLHTTIMWLWCLMFTVMNYTTQPANRFLYGTEMKGNQWLPGAGGKIQNKINKNIMYTWVIVKDLKLAVWESNSNLELTTTRNISISFHIIYFPLMIPYVLDHKDTSSGSAKHFFIGSRTAKSESFCWPTTGI